MNKGFPESIRDKALERLKQQCSGNGIDEGSIDITIREDASGLYPLSLRGFVTIEPELSPLKKGVQKARKAGQVKTLDSSNKLAQEVENLRQKALGDQKLKNRLSQACIEGTADHENITLPGYKAVYEITKTCSQCSGSALIICLQCSGKGKATCPQCQGQRQQLCWNCHGQGTTQNSDGSRQGCQYCQASGRILCQACNGSAIISCKSCGGQGKTKCSSCGGQGHIIEYAQACLHAKIDWSLEPLATSNDKEETPPLLSRTVLACNPFKLIKKGEVKAQKQLAARHDSAEEDESDNYSPNVSRETHTQMQINLQCEVAFAEAEANINGEKQNIVILGEKGRIQNIKPVMRRRMQKLIAQMSQATKRRSALYTAIKRYKREAFFKRAISLLNDYSPKLAMARFYKEHDLLFEKNQIQPFFKILHKALRSLSGKRGKTLPITGGLATAGSFMGIYIMTQLVQDTLYRQTAHMPELSIAVSLFSDIIFIGLASFLGIIVARLLDRLLSQRALHSLGLPAPKNIPIMTPYGPIIFITSIGIYALIIILNLGGEMPIWLRSALSTALF